MCADDKRGGGGKSRRGSKLAKEKVPDFRDGGLDYTVSYSMEMLWNCFRNDPVIKGHPEC